MRNTDIESKVFGCETCRGPGSCHSRGRGDHAHLSQLSVQGMVHTDRVELCEAVFNAKLTSCETHL